ncbi:Toxin YoeB [Methanimicrococcus stummii]|uniref:Putative mRNA interferase YoeB n=1 Tax=Methanimicrococcus stummii TaxID=3028294 RepID=A0AA97A899_9EURY|nr:Toxin YoeB [Methanimicrococcus sp. Es2]
MKVIFSEKAWKEYTLFQNNNDLRQLKKINKLITEIQRNGFSKGEGNPEPLKYQYSGCWSRRIDLENRLIYKLDDNQNLLILRCKGHYEEK